MLSKQNITMMKGRLPFTLNPIVRFYVYNIYVSISINRKVPLKLLYICHLRLMSHKLSLLHSNITGRCISYYAAQVNSLKTLVSCSFYKFTCKNVSSPTPRTWAKSHLYWVDRCFRSIPLPLSLYLILQREQDFSTVKLCNTTA